MIKRWVCTECGDIIESGCTHAPRSCEVCHSVLSFVEIKDRTVPVSELGRVRVLVSHESSATEND